MTSAAALDQRSPIEQRAVGRGTRVLFVALALLPLLPLWALPHFPSQDGPAHLEIAGALRELLRSPQGLYARYFAINTAPEPNWFVYPILMALDRWTAPETAEKVVVSLYLLALPLATLRAVRALRPAGAHVAFLALPLALNYPLHMGFYNFAFGLAAFFLIVGYHARCHTPMSARETAGLAALLLIAYFCHAVPLAMALLAVGCSILIDAAAGGLRAPTERRRLAVALTRLSIAAAPSVVLLALFVSRDNGPAPEPMSLTTLARQLGVLYSLVSFGTAEIAVSATLLVVLAALAATVLRARSSAPSRPRWPARGDGFLLGAAATTALYFLAPAGLAGGGYLNQRLQLFIVFFVLLWLAGRPETDRRRRTIVAAGTVLAIGSAAVHAVHYARIGEYLDEYRSAASVLEPGHTVLPLSFDHRGASLGREPGRPGATRLALSRRVFPFEHAAGRLAARQGLVDLNSYQASRAYFPIAYREECDPVTHLGTIEELSSEQPAARLDGYAGTAGCDVDYVLVWAAGPQAHTNNALLRELDARFDRIFSSPRGLVEIYRRVPGSPAAPASAGKAPGGAGAALGPQSAAQ